MPQTPSVLPVHCEFTTFWSMSSLKLHFFSSWVMSLGLSVGGVYCSSKCLRKRLPWLFHLLSLPHLLRGHVSGALLCACVPNTSLQVKPPGVMLYLYLCPRHSNRPLHLLSAVCVASSARPCFGIHTTVATICLHGHWTLCQTSP